MLEFYRSLDFLHNFLHMPEVVRLCYGDVIGVHRLGGLYEHYGIYENDECVYEYAAQDGDFGSAIIHTATLKKFLGESKNCFVLQFPEQYGTPKKLSFFPILEEHSIMPNRFENTLEDLLDTLRVSTYHLYSPEETVLRARSRLGETKYNLAFNNCEHFAIWCKTGVHESHQANEVLRTLLRKIPVEY